MLYKIGGFLILISYTFVFDLLPAVLPGSGDALLSGRRQDMDNDFSRILSDPGILSAVFLADERRQLNSGPALWLLKSPVVFPCWISVLAQDSQSIRNHIRILYSLILRNYGIVKSGIMNFRG